MRANETVLLVEDDRSVRRLTASILSSAGYRVVEAAGRAEALERLPKEDAIVHHGVLDQGVVLIQKPFRSTEMLEKVRTTLDTPGPKV